MFQAEKKVVLNFYQALQDGGYTSNAAVRAHTTEDYQWRGYHPFGELERCVVMDTFWVPLANALSHLQRHQDVFFAGANEIDGFKSHWVASMGHMTGLFDKPWLGIFPSHKIASLYYAEFHRVEDGLIAQSAMYFDIPHLMAQAGQSPFVQQTDRHRVQPEPVGHDGLLLVQQDAEEGHATLACINAMIQQLGQWQNALPLEDELRLSWHEDMRWWGPEGIGASHTIAHYAQQHARPFRQAFGNRSKTRHLCRMAEGQYGGFFGWPNFSATLDGFFMGREPTHQVGEFRVIDIYRRRGNKLAENWVFIDLPYFWKQQGWDLLSIQNEDQ